MGSELCLVWNLSKGAPQDSEAAFFSVSARKRGSPQAPIPQRQAVPVVSRQGSFTKRCFPASSVALGTSLPLLHPTFLVRRLFSIPSASTSPPLLEGRPTWSLQHWPARVTHRSLLLPLQASGHCPCDESSVLPASTGSQLEPHGHLCPVPLETQSDLLSEAGTRFVQMNTTVLDAVTNARCALQVSLL